MSRDYLSFDIETSGFGYTDEITVAGYYSDALGGFLFLNTNGRDTGNNLEAEVWKEADIYPVVETFESERDLLVRMKEFHENLGDGIVLVAFNGETWKGGFDLPFVRTSALQSGVSGVFSGREYLDLQDVIRKRWNTTRPDHNDLQYIDQARSFAQHLGLDVDDLKRKEIDKKVESHGYDYSELQEWVEAYNEENEEIDIPMKDSNSLDDAYEVLAEGAHPSLQHGIIVDFDPFEESKEAVTSWENGEWVDLLLHNFADVVQTWQLCDIISEETPNYYMKTDIL